MTSRKKKDVNKEKNVEEKEVQIEFLEESTLWVPGDDGRPQYRYFVRHQNTLIPGSQLKELDAQNIKYKVV